MIGTTPQHKKSIVHSRLSGRSVVIVCPDARPPAYELVRGLAEQGLANRFATGYYHVSRWWHRPLGRTASGSRFLGSLERRRIPNVAHETVEAFASYDLSIRLENRLASRWPKLRGRAARRRTERFDRQSAERMSAWADDGAQIAVFFSDVGSDHAMAAAKRCGLKVVLSMVTGHMDEEIEVLEREKTRSPQFCPAYLGDGALDMDELRWLHERRRRDLEQADLILTPSEHIANLVVERSGVPRDRIRVIPYAADARRFVPCPKYVSEERCRFLFAGGITQRKGLSDLLDAWSRVRRPGWSLTMVGEAPRLARALIPADDATIELVGRVPYGEMPRLMAAHDVFVFPSLFEGSAVVCYEALASGLPVITTPQAGSVVRSGTDGTIVPAADAHALAAAMIELGHSPHLRESYSRNARNRAMEHTWDHYRERVIDALGSLTTGHGHLPDERHGSVE